MENNQTNIKTDGKTTRTQLRATCPDCKVSMCMRHSGDGEWICESRKSKFCGYVIEERRISRSQTKFIEVTA